MLEAVRRRWSTYFPPEVVQSTSGLRVPIKATPDLYKMRSHFLRNTYESKEADAARKILKKGDKVLELGAGCGFMTATAAQIVGAKNVLSYEANEGMKSSIEAVLEANRLDVEVRYALIGERDGTSDFYVAQNFSSSSSINRKGDATKRSVDTHNFARVVGEFRPTVVLMDVEGAEAAILKKPLPLYVRAVSGEFHPHIIGVTETSNLVKGLLDQGFLLNLLASGGKVLSFERV